MSSNKDSQVTDKDSQVTDSQVTDSKLTETPEKAEPASSAVGLVVQDPDGKLVEVPKAFSPVRSDPIPIPIPDKLSEAFKARAKEREETRTPPMAHSPGPPMTPGSPTSASDNFDVTPFFPMSGVNSPEPKRGKSDK